MGAWVRRNKIITNLTLSPSADRDPSLNLCPLTEPIVRNPHTPMLPSPHRYTYADLTSGQTGEFQFDSDNDSNQVGGGKTLLVSFAPPHVRPTSAFAVRRSKQNRLDRHSGMLNGHG